MKRTLTMDCKHCGKSFDDKHSLDKHLAQTHTDTMLYHCDVCSKSFHLKGRYTDHMKSHTNDDVQYECTECPSFFKNPGHLSSHIRREHRTNGLTYSCSHCPKRFPDKSVLNSHTKMCHTPVMKIHKCQFCSKMLNSKRMLKWHIHSTHNKNFKKTSCPYCPSEFTWPHHLKAHVKKKHIDEGHIPTDLLKNGLFAIRRQKNNCFICSEKLTSKLDLMLHLRNVHNQEIDIYKCCRCVAVFSMKNSFKLHLDKHRREAEMNENHRCDQCCAESSPKPYVKQIIDHNEVKADSSAVKNEIIDFEVTLMEYRDIRRLIRYRKKHSTKMRLLCDTKIEIEIMPSEDTSDVQCASIKEDDNESNHLPDHTWKLNSPVKYGSEDSDNHFESVENDNSQSSEKSSRKDFIEVEIEPPKVSFDVSLTSRSNQSRNDSIREELSPVINTKEKRKVVKQYKCKICDIEFNSPLMLGRHLKQMHKKVKANTDAGYICKICDKTFESNISRLHHSRLAHKKWRLAKEYYCDKCNLKFTNHHKYAIHIKIKHPVTKSEGVKLDSSKGETTDSPSGTTSPKTKKTNVKRQSVVEKSYECGKCVIFFDSKLELLRHISDKHMPIDTHVETGPLRMCDFCSSKFTDKNVLIQHLKENHSDKSLYNCVKCKLNFNSEKDFQEHLKLHRHKCSVCHIYFVNRDKLIAHMSGHKEAKAHNCDICRTTFRSQVTLDCHMKTMHRANSKNTKGVLNALLEKCIDKSKPNVTKVKITADIEKIMQKCYNCRALFPDKDALQRHMLREHTEGVTLHKCGQCASIYNDIDELKEHLQLEHQASR